MRETNETAVFYVRHDDEQLALFRVESQQPVQSHVKAGDLVRMDRGSAARVLAAFYGAKVAVYKEIREKGWRRSKATAYRIYQVLRHLSSG